MATKERITQHFMSLVQIDSETKHEQEISVVLKKELEALGFSVEEDESAAITGHGSGNLIGILEASDGCKDVPTMLFTCHMDTVAPGIGVKPQLDADGYIRSDGTTVLGADDKAGIAALFEAIKVIGEKDIKHGRIQVVITAGEESGLRGARALDASKLEAQFGYALDSNGAIGDIAVAAPTQAKVTMEFKGKSAHAGVNPEDGISAIQMAAKAISRMPLGRIDKETTANIGSFEGGGATNVVCDYVKLNAEARSIVQSKLEAQLAAMKQAVEQTAAEFGGQGTLTSEIVYPSYQHDETSPVVQLAMAAVRAVGRTPRTFHSGGGSDANVFNGLGVPTVNLAVGYEFIHTTKEQIKADNLVLLAELVVEIVKRSTVGRGDRNE